MGRFQPSQPTKQTPFRCILSKVARIQDPASNPTSALGPVATPCEKRTATARGCKPVWLLGLGKRDGWFQAPSEITFMRSCLACAFHTIPFAWPAANSIYGKVLLHPTMVEICCSAAMPSLGNIQIDAGQARHLWNSSPRCSAAQEQTLPGSE